MAGRETSGREIEPGIIARIAAGVRYAISGGNKPGESESAAEFFGPGQPLVPVAQEQAAGRAFDYPFAVNTRTAPRDTEPVSFAQLRGLADGYDLMRLVIETRKDQIEAFEWEIQPVDKDANPDSMKSEIKGATDFLLYPDKQNNWQQWLRQVVEELLVIDTVCVYPRASRGGKLWGLELVDGATIRRLLDAGGRTPLPPDPAFQQILKGLPAADYTSEDLLYLMRNPRVSRIYGFSPVEQVITTVNIALRRQMSQLAFYTEGNIPEALALVPETWTPKQVQDFQSWWDSVMEGNLASRRKMKFIPPVKSIEYPKQGMLKDEYDEWLARIVCFAFSISPSALIKQVNRASGEQMADTAKSEGLMPLLRFLETFFTQLIQRNLEKPNLRFAWRLVDRVSPVDQAKVHSTYINTEVMTPDEAREQLGMAAMTEEERRTVFPMPLAFNQAILQAGAEGEDDSIVPAFQSPDGKVKPGGPAHSTGVGTGVAKPGSGKEKPMSAAEKALFGLLEKTIDALGPERAVEILRAMPTPVVKIGQPDVQVNVGDTVVNVPRDSGLDKLAKGAERQAEALGDGLARMGEGIGEIGKALISIPAPVVNVAPPAVHVQAPEQTINVAAPVVNIPPAQVTVNLPAPEVRIEAPVTVTNTVPEAKVENHVHLPEAGASEELIERDDKGEIVRVTKRPLD